MIRQSNLWQKAMRKYVQQPCAVIKGDHGSSQDRHSTAQVLKQPARNSAFAGGESRVAGTKGVTGKQSIFGLQQRMHVPAAMDISGLITAPTKPAAKRVLSGVLWSLPLSIAFALPQGPHAANRLIAVLISGGSSSHAVIVFMLQAWTVV